MKKWILDRYASSAFNKCEHQPTKKLTGEPLGIHWKPDAKPVAVFTPATVPVHLKDRVKQDLDRDVRLEIIERVPQGTPTTWCSRALTAVKANGDPRRVVAYNAVNKASLRETHHVPSPFNLASSVPADTVKSTFDDWNGYHVLPLTDEAKKAFTFITEFGQYRPLTAPQGFHGSGDGYTRRTDDITSDVERKRRCVDDSLLYDTSIEEAFWHTIDYIILCHENGIIFNREKFQFAKNEVDFAGFTITMDGIKPTKKMIAAIESFPVPKNITDLRSFLGLVNQVSYAFSESKKLDPFRSLLKKETAWYWDSNLDKIFQESKKFIVEQVIDGIKSFEVNRPCSLWTDWSKEGIGFSLFQKRCDCAPVSPTCCKTGWKLVFAKSRFTKDAERGYAPIEGEALALVYALEKCKMFIQGGPTVTVVTDHNPLTGIFNDKSLEKIENTRIFKLKEKTLPFDFHVVHVKGTENKAADACSRYPTDGSSTPSSMCVMRSIHDYIRAEDSDGDEEVDLADLINEEVQSSIIASMGFSEDGGVSAVTFSRVKSESEKDQCVLNLIRHIGNGFPAKKSDLSEDLRPFWNVRFDLSVLNGVVLFKRRVLVPSSLRHEVLETLHSAHQGTTGMKARASESFYWPGFNRDIMNT